MIRPAELADIPKLVELGLKLHAESSYNYITYSDDKVKKTCEMLIKQGFANVAVQNGEVIGVMLGDVYSPWYSEDITGLDYTLYIEPEHRNGLIAVKLVKAFENWCISMGAKQIRPGVGTGHAGAIRLYKAMGYHSVGEYFLKNI